MTKFYVAELWNSVFDDWSIILCGAENESKASVLKRAQRMYPHNNAWRTRLMEIC